MISSLIEWPHRSTCHHPSRHNRGEATGTWIPRQIEDIPSIISIQSASNSLIALSPQRGQVHPGLIWQDTIRAGPSSRERTWPLLFLGCRIAAGPWRCQSRMDGKMGVKSPEKGGKMATFAGTCYVAVYGPTPLFS